MTGFDLGPGIAFVTGVDLHIMHVGPAVVQVAMTLALGDQFTDDLIVDSNLELFHGTS